MSTQYCPILILGSGIAGLSTALKLAQHTHVTIVSKNECTEGSTRYAQGGIAAVWSPQDSFQDHIEDTLKAGAGLCHRDIVELCVREGPERIQELIELGVAFSTSNSGQYDLNREGGHGKRRILHSDDLTGWAIEKALFQKVKEHPNIRILEHHVVIDLITEGKILKHWRKPGRCLGAYVFNRNTQEVITLKSALTILATGGAGKVYLYTSNPDTNTGDGIAMAYRAGARIANLEFMQFHPTCLYHPQAKTFLISEALRGEGARLLNLDHEDFMLRHHSLGALAPRDIVARAIDFEMKRRGDPHVWLDASIIPGQTLKKKFPNIYATCLQFGRDITQEPIAVVPAAHYTCGGVWTNAQGETTLPGLYAVGEVACTGLHGANRLASNSLLEAVVFAHRVAQHARQSLPQAQELSSHADPYLPEWESGQAVPIEEKIDITAHWFEIRSLMWNYVGIVRSNRRLERAQRRLALFKSEINAYYWDFLINQDLIELRNLIQVAEIIVQSAILRQESRGLHYTVDYPDNSREPSKDTFLQLPAL